jgi:hypothetical protein
VLSVDAFHANEMLPASRPVIRKLPGTDGACVSSLGLLVRTTTGALAGDLVPFRSNATTVNE